MKIHNFVMIGIALTAIFCLLIGLGIGYDLGIEYQKAQPITVAFQSISNGDPVDMVNTTMTPENTLGLPASGEYIEKNNVTSWYIRVRNGS